MRSTGILPHVLLAGVAVMATPGHAASYHYDPATNRITVGGGGATTLSEIKEALPQAPLERVTRDGRVWMLSAGLVVTGGTTLLLRGAAAGGDVNELRLRSVNGAGARHVSFILAAPGTLELRATRVLSWDTAADGPDLEYARFGRAFIVVQSSLANDGVTPLESRMDIVDSEVAYLGHDVARERGLTWIVAARTPADYEKVRVHARVVASHLHHNFAAGELIGAREAVWRENEIAHNVLGVHAAEDSDGLTFAHNFVHDNAGDALVVDTRSGGAAVTENEFRGNGPALRFSDAVGVRFAENLLPDDLSLRLTGSFEHRTSIEIRAQPRINLVTDTYSTAEFRDAHHAVFDVDGDTSISTDTTVPPDGDSALTMRAPATVFTRPLFVHPASDTVRVNPYFWMTEESANKGWRARSFSASQTVRYRVGELLPFETYFVHQGGELLGEFTADRDGFIAFESVPGVTSTLNYSVTRRE